MKRKMALSSCAFGVMSACHGTAFAQNGMSTASSSDSIHASSEGSSDSANDRDIVVTARRRAERLQDAPVAVTALNSAALERHGIVGLVDIQKVAPSLNISASAAGGRNVPVFTIRGQRQGETLASSDPSVGVYVGDVLFKRTYGLDQIIFDLGAVEVLKGPQGTLFGLNTTGGNIIFRPNLPTDNLEAGLTIGAGNYAMREARGYLNLPLGTDAALRIAGSYKKRDGYLHNVTTGQDAQDLDGYGLRATLRWNVTPDVQTIFTGNYQHSSMGGSGWRLKTLEPKDLSGSTTPLFGAAGYGATALQNALTASNALGDLQIASNYPARSRTDPAWNIANTTTFQISPAISIKNVIGYRRYSVLTADDNDGSPLAILENTITQRGSEFSEELQILGEGEGYNWIAGFYYERERVNSLAYEPDLVSPFLRGIQTPYTYTENVKNSSRSVFASGTVKLNRLLDGLSFTGGVRYTWDHRFAQFGQTLNLGYKPGDLTGFGTPSVGQSCSFNPASDPDVLLPQYNFNPATCLVSLNKNFSKFTYSTTLDWKISSTKMVYLAHRTGYRAGGYGTRSVLSGQLVPFAPETVSDAEVGVKADWNFAGGMFLRTNVAAYRQWYSNIQKQVPVVVSNGTIATNIVNAAKATISGFEVEAMFAPVKALELSGSLSYVDPKYGRFLSGGVDISDQAVFAGIPKWQVNASARLNVPIPETMGDLAIQLSYYHQSSFTIMESNIQQPAAITAGYGLLNGRVEMNHIAGLPLDAALFVENITDNRYHAADYALQYNFGFASYFVGPPRMFGLELTYKYK